MCMLAILAISNPCFASYACPYNGFFCGISVGKAQTFGTQQTDSSYQFFDSVGPEEWIRTVSTKERIYRNSPAVSLTLGYSQL